MTLMRLPFDEVFADESGGNIKTPQSEYLRNGRFPVVDQGKALIAGYVNDPERICGGGRPAIVFGDHTRCVKFVDHPFCMGADGVKVLRPKVDADLKYLYYYLKQLRLPDAGYDRHFKYLKRTEVVLFPLSEQRRIAAILDRADASRTKRRESLAQLDHLTQSIFLDMFGDPVTGPTGCAPKLLADCVSKLEYGPRFYHEAYSSDGVRIVRITDLDHSGALDFDSMPRMAVDELTKRRFILQDGDIVFARTGATVGKVALIRESDPPCIAGAYFIRLRFDESLVPLYAFSVLRAKSVQALIEKKSRQAAQQNFSGPGLRSLPMPIPPMSMQRDFEKKVGKVRIEQERFAASLSVMDSLYASLQHRAFRGEV